MNTGYYVGEGREFFLKNVKLYVCIIESYKESNYIVYTNNYRPKLYIPIYYLINHFINCIINCIINYDFLALTRNLESFGEIKNNKFLSLLNTIFHIFFFFFFVTSVQLFFQSIKPLKTIIRFGNFVFMYFSRRVNI